MRARRSWIGPAAKLVVTIALLAWLVSKVSMGPALAQVLAMRPAAALAAVALLLVQLVLGSWRWQLISGLLEAPMTGTRAVRYTLVGQFFNQVLPTSLGGDAVRAWLAARDGAPLGRAVRAVVCDRVVGLVVLLVVISATGWVWRWFAAPAPVAMRDFLRTTAIVTLLGVPMLYAIAPPLVRQLPRLRWARAAGDIVLDARRAIFSGPPSVAILGTSLACHVIPVGAMCLCANGMGIPLDFGTAMMVGPTIVLVAMAPLSLAGWGLREGAMVVGLGVLGVPAGQALAVSVAYGLMQILAGLPGGVLWLVGPRISPASAD